jgi:hypothetical protein
MMAQVVWAAPLLIGHCLALATGAAATEALPAVWNGIDLIVGNPRRRGWDSCRERRAERESSEA